MQAGTKNFGFTLLELVIVLILLVILSTILIALFPSLTDGGRQSTTVTNLRSISSAMSLYRADHNAYPVATDIIGLAAILEPNYINSLVKYDGWGQPFYVNSSASTYTIGTGAKGWDGSESLTSEPQGPTTSFESDIILTDGVFTQFPDRQN